MKFCTAKMPDKMTTMRNWGSSSGTSMVNTRLSVPTPSMVAGVQHVLRQVLQPAEEDQEPEVGDPREADQQDPGQRQVRVAEPGRLGQPDGPQEHVDQPGLGWSR